MWQKKSHLVSLVERVDRSLHKAILAGHPFGENEGWVCLLNILSFRLTPALRCLPPPHSPSHFLPLACVLNNCLFFPLVLTLELSADDHTLSSQGTCSLQMLTLFQRKYLEIFQPKQIAYLPECSSTVLEIETLSLVLPQSFIIQLGGLEKQG